MHNTLSYNGKTYGFVNEEERNSAAAAMEHGIKVGDDEKLIEHMIRFNGIPLDRNIHVFGVTKGFQQVVEYVSTSSTEIAFMAESFLAKKLPDSNIYIMTPAGEILTPESIEYLKGVEA
jgi:hypothetical protein